MSQALYTSDTHFGHTNVIDYCDRQYRKSEYPYAADVHAMNLDLIARWNATVGHDDHVWHLGDFALGDKDDARFIFQLLNGHKHLVLGNHDRSAQAMRQWGWETAEKSHRCDLKPLGRVLMQHHPQTYEVLDRGGYRYQLCGHVHEKWARARTEKRYVQTQDGNKAYVHGTPDPAGRVVNVGVDVRSMRPVTLEQLFEPVA